LLADPGFEPDPLSFPTDVIDVFIDTRAKIREKISAAAQVAAQAEAERKAREAAQRQREIARVAALEQMAGEERILVKHSRWLALVPFGVGQFQNGQPTWGWVFLTSEPALALGPALTVAIYQSELKQRSDDHAAGRDFEAQQHID